MGPSAPKELKTRYGTNWTIGLTCVPEGALSFLYLAYFPVDVGGKIQTMST